MHCRTFNEVSTRDIYGQVDLSEISLPISLLEGRYRGYPTIKYHILYIDHKNVSMFAIYMILTNEPVKCYIYLHSMTLLGVQSV